MDFTQEYEGFVQVNDQAKRISVTIHEFNLIRCKDLYDGVNVEEINILETVTLDEVANLSRTIDRKDCNRLILKLTDEQAFELLL